MLITAYLILGVFAGAMAGLVGIAGGIFLVPALIFLFHYSQKTAQGTTLAVLLPPIGIAAAYLYYRAGHVNVRAAIFIALGFLIGGFIGARLGNHLSDAMVQRIFGLFTLAVALKLLFFK
jgi:uncharacterized membrane protein YfcA